MGYLTLLKYQIGASIKRNKTLNKLVLRKRKFTAVEMMLILAISTIIVIALYEALRATGVTDRIKQILGWETLNESGTGEGGTGEGGTGAIIENAKDILFS